MNEVSKDSAPPEFRSRDDFERWLEDRPREWSVVLATRAALRVLPLVTTERPKKRSEDTRHRRLDQLMSAVLRSTAIGRAAVKYPTRSIETSAASDASGAALAESIPDTPSSAAVAAAAYAADAADAATDSDACSDAILAIERATYATESAANAADSSLDALSLDAIFLATGGSPRALASEPLWLSAWPPRRITAAWARTRAALPMGESWEVWIDWYEARLKKSRWSKKKELVYASVPLEVWEKGHVAANRWIYEELQKLKPAGHSRENEEINDRKLVEQSPAPTSFRIVGEKIDVAPENVSAIDDMIATTFYDEVKRKSRELRERLERAQADKRLQGNLALLEARLGASLADVSVSHLLPSLYSLERDFAVYNSEEGRKEHSLELIAALGDAAGSVRDFVALFPKVRQIEAEALALRIVQQPEIQEEIAEQGRKAIAAASDSPHVTPAAESALRDTEKSVATARDADERARQLSYLVLDLANFARAGIVLAAKEVGGFTGDCWREIRSRVPSRIGKLAALGVTLYGLSTLAENLPLEKIKLLRDLGSVTEKLGKLIEDKPPPKAGEKASTSEPNESTRRPQATQESRATDNNPPPHAEERPKGASRSARGSSRRRK